MPGPQAVFVDELIKAKDGTQTWVLRAYDPEGEDKPGDVRSCD